MAAMMRIEVTSHPKAAERTAYRVDSQPSNLTPPQGRHRRRALPSALMLCPADSFAVTAPSAEITVHLS